MSSKKLTSTQIAKLAGVARSTVSKVINNYPDIPEATKQKVMAVIEEHQYKPNVFSSALKGIPQKVITLYIHTTKNDALASTMDNLDSAYVMSVMSNFIYCANQKGYSLQVEIIHECDDQQQVFSKIRNAFDDKLICAAVFLGLTDHSTFIDQLTLQNYRVAAIDRLVEESCKALNVLTDDLQGAYQATKALIAQGYQYIAFVGGDATKLSARKREEGYLKALKEAKLVSHIIPCGYSEVLARSVAKDIANSEVNIDALLCASDIIAYGLIRELDSHYFDKVGIVGFDNLPFNEYQQPPLSSVSVDYKQMAEATLDALISDETVKQVMVGTTFHQRASSVKEINSGCFNNPNN